MRVEIAVFGVIIIFVIAMAFLVDVPLPASGSLPNLGMAPELAGITGWMNSEPLEIRELKGKVVLMDFWTYSCINCIRTLPYLTAWHEKYSGSGLVIIGVHTPEFQFEKDTDNVRAAVEKYGIEYPVAQDNDYATWRAYGNNFWPRKYLIDSEGNIRYDHIGEGAYEETEEAIQKLLMEAGHSIQEGTLEETAGTDFLQIGTPELYLGYMFARSPLGNTEGFFPGNTVDYRPVDRSQLKPNTIYLYGKWRNEADSVVSEGNSGLLLVYKARDVNIVAGGISSVSVLLDRKPLEEVYLGSDTEIIGTNAVALIEGHRLYNIVSAPDYGIHTLELQAGPGFELYTFTFG